MNGNLIQGKLWVFIFKNIVSVLLDDFITHKLLISEESSYIKQGDRAGPGEGNSPLLNPRV